MYRIKLTLYTVKDRPRTKKVHVGVVAVEVKNPENGCCESVYVFHDGDAQITLLHRSVADRLGLHGKKFVQPCKGFLATADVDMESASIHVRGLWETEYHHVTKVRVTKQVPSMSHYLPHTLMLEVHP